MVRKKKTAPIDHGKKRILSLEAKRKTWPKEQTEAQLLYLEEHGLTLRENPWGLNFNGPHMNAFWADVIGPSVETSLETGKFIEPDFSSFNISGLEHEIQEGYAQIEANLWRLQLAIYEHLFKDDIPYTHQLVVNGRCFESACSNQGKKIYRTVGMPLEVTDRDNLIYESQRDYHLPQLFVPECKGTLDETVRSCARRLTPTSSFYQLIPDVGEKKDPTIALRQPQLGVLQVNRRVKDPRQAAKNGFNDFMGTKANRPHHRSKAQVSSPEELYLPYLPENHVPLLESIQTDLIGFKIPVRDPETGDTNKLNYVFHSVLQVPYLELADIPRLINRPGSYVGINAVFYYHPPHHEVGIYVEGQITFMNSVRDDRRTRTSYKEDKLIAEKNTPFANAFREPYAHHLSDPITHSH